VLILFVGVEGDLIIPSKGGDAPIEGNCISRDAKESRVGGGRSKRKGYLQRERRRLKKPKVIVRDRFPSYVRVYFLSHSVRERGGAKGTSGAECGTLRRQKGKKKGSEFNKKN